MTTRDARIAILLAIAGIGVCLAGLLAFVINVANNTLPWTHPQSMREHYLAVGQSYSQGFFIGFFLCFFLTLVALAVWNRIEHRRATVQPMAAQPQPERGWFR